jgi:hypothetical protein
MRNLISELDAKNEGLHDRVRYLEWRLRDVKDALCTTLEICDKRMLMPWEKREVETARKALRGHG